MRSGDRVRVEKPRAGHIKKAFVNRHLLHHRRKAAADGKKGPGASAVQLEIRPDQHKLRAFAERQADRFSGHNAEFFRRNGFGQNDAGPLAALPADGRRKLPQVRLPARHAPGRLPGQKRTVDVHMKHKPLHKHAPHPAS